MQKIRVLIVDDSAVMRRILREAFQADGNFEVIGVAANGRIAVSMVQQNPPDIVTLDIEMPEMDGLEALGHIRAKFPRLPVIIFSTLTVNGAEATIKALALGASDYVTKPADVGNFSAAIERVGHHILPKAKALCSGHLSAFDRKSQVVKTGTHLVSRSPSNNRVDVVAIGTSTGGPNALASVLPHIPADFPVPLLIVQHMPPLFTKFLADRLTSGCQFPVREAVSGVELSPGIGWVAPGDYHMAVSRLRGRSVLQLHKGPPEKSCRPSVDVLFRSVADAYGPGVLAVVLTGMGQDGLHGCEQIRAKGGQIIVQDESTSVVWGMPGFVARAGLADRTLSLQQIGPEIVRRCWQNRAIGARVAAR